MALEFLKNLFGQNDDGTPKALTADELVAAIGSAKLKVVNLGDGGYVAQDKFDRVSEELKTVKGQLTAANTEIQSYKDMDIDAVKKAADDWKAKYEQETAALTKKLTDQEYDFAMQSYLGQYDFADALAAEGVQARFRGKGFKLADGKFEGADAFMEELKKSNPGAFKPAVPEQNPPQFTNPGGGNPPAPGEKKMSLTEIMEYANKNPGTNIDALLQKLG